MNILLLLLGPTIMIFLGLQVLGSVPATFLIFYGWLALVPLSDLLFWKKWKVGKALKELSIILHWKNAIYGSATGILFLLLIVLGGFFFHSFLFERAHLLKLLESWKFSGNLAVWLIVILMFINPVLEEVYWRGYLYQKLAGKRSPRTVILLTSFFYSLYHLLSVIPLFAWPYNLAMVIPVFIAGVIWGYIRFLHRSLIGSILSHILADVGIMAVYLLFLA